MKKNAAVLTRKPTASTTKADLDAAADLLRVVADGEVPLYDTIEQALSLTVTGHGPTTIMRQLGMSRAELVDLIKGIGHRYRVRGEKLPENQAPVLFPLEPDLEVIQKFRKPKRERLLKEAAQMRKNTPLPMEWDREFPTEVGVRNAVIAMRSKVAVDANLRSIALRYAGSLQAPKTGLTTYSLLRGVWQVAHLGQFHRLATSDEITPKAAQSIVLAYDSLESVRADGAAALRELHTTRDMATLAGLAVRARPLAEAAIRRLESILLISDDRHYLARALQLFRNETEHFEIPQHIGQLNDGQVHRIAHMQGKNTDGVPSPEVVATEDKLRELDLAQDIPWLKGMWLAAYNTRRVDEFWSAIDRLLDGDPKWADTLG